MGKSWSKEALAAVRGYPWGSEREKARAVGESELVAFGDRVEMGDLPAEVRRWAAELLAGAAPAAGGGGAAVNWWESATLDEKLDECARKLLGEALEHFGGNTAAAARAIGSTPRVVRYNARRLGLAARTRRAAGCE